MPTGARIKALWYSQFPVFKFLKKESFDEAQTVLELMEIFLSQLSSARLQVWATNHTW